MADEFLPGKHRKHSQRYGFNCNIVCATVLSDFLCAEYSLADCVVHYDEHGNPSKSLLKPHNSCSHDISKY